MNLNGEVRIPAPRARVWEALNDSRILKAAIPGCEEIIQISATELEAAVVAKVGPVKAKFKGRITLSELDPPNSYVISGEGTGGAAGFAKGSANVTLEDDGEGTLLRYEVNAQVGGKLVQIGSRLIDAAAKKLARDFFEAFTALLTPTEIGDQTPEADGAHLDRADRAAAPDWVWAIAALALGAGSLVYFSS